MQLSESTQRPEGFEDKVENLLFMKKKVQHRYAETINEIRNLAKGSDPDGLRDQYYVGWTDQDLADLLKEIGEKP